MPGVDGHEPHVTNHRPGLVSAGVGDKNLTAILLEKEHGDWKTVDVGVMAKKRYQDLLAANARNAERYEFTFGWQFTIYRRNT
jgi:hypothetical protein